MVLVSGIVLAGGASKRMQENKMMLPFKKRPIIHHTIQTMETICDEIIVVTGFYQRDYLTEFNYKNSIKQVHNIHHPIGMFTSVLEGIKYIQSDCFIIPGDYPLVSAKTYQVLNDATGVIRVPTYQGRRGHPIFIEESVIEILRNEPLGGNLKEFRDRYTVTYVEVDDPYILFDIDDQEEYKKLLEFERMDEQ